MSPRIKVSNHLGHPEGQFEEGYVSGTNGSDGGYVDAGASTGASSAPSTPSLGHGYDMRKAHLEGKEIIKFLRDRGAKISELDEGDDGDWAAAPSGLSSSETEDNDHESHPEDTVDEIVWVSPGASSEIGRK